MLRITGIVSVLAALLVTLVMCTMHAQSDFYLLRIDRKNQRIGLRGPGRVRIPFVMERKTDDGTIMRDKLDWLPVCTKTVRFVAPEGPRIPNDPYGNYCELPPAGGRNEGWYKVGPIEDIPEGSKDFGYYAIPLRGRPADEHGRTGLLIHGGGNKLPDPLADFQGWQCTHGCVKMQNAHLRVLVNTLRSLPPDADIRLIVDGGKCKLNDIVAEVYRWDEFSGTWKMVEDKK